MSHRTLTPTSHHKHTPLGETLQCKVQTSSAVSGSCDVFLLLRCPHRMDQARWQWR
jgi:hypothetical protein